MTVIIEKACVADKPRIFELLEQANMHHIPSKEMPGLTYENYYVAKVDGIISGFCGYKILSSNEAKTELMVVDTRYRSLGIGYKLQEFRMEIMFKKGIKKLITNTDLPATIKWYKNHFGYKEVGSLKKDHEFGDPYIDQWTTLSVDLCLWNSKKKESA